MAENVTLSSTKEHHMWAPCVLCCSLLKGSECLSGSDSEKPSLSYAHNQDATGQRASWIWLWGLMTPTLGLDLKPGVSQRLSKVIIHGTCDGHRVGHGLCFFVVFSETAAEVLLDHRVAYCVGYNNNMCGKSRPRGWLLPSIDL